MNGERARSVLVTGGTTRLGLAIADCLRGAGWRVLTSSHRPDAGADFVADLSEPMGAAKLYSAALGALGGEPPAALVNNAALFVGDDAAVEAVNLSSPQKLTMMMAGREKGRGAVVNILDAALLPRPFDGSALSSGDIRHSTAVSRSCAPGSSKASSRYVSSKLALLEFTVKSAVMFSDTLRVNAVAPGPVFAPVGVHEKAGETILGRPTPEAVAKAVAFLLDADSTTGAVIPVDGGQHLS